MWNLHMSSAGKFKWLCIEIILKIGTVYPNEMSHVMRRISHIRICYQCYMIKGLRDVLWWITFIYPKKQIQKSRAIRFPTELLMAITLKSCMTNVGSTHSLRMIGIMLAYACLLGLRTMDQYRINRLQLCLADE